MLGNFTYGNVVLSAERVLGVPAFCIFAKVGNRAAVPVSGCMFKDPIELVRLLATEPQWIRDLSNKVIIQEAIQAWYDAIKQESASRPTRDATLGTLSF